MTGLMGQGSNNVRVIISEQVSNFSDMASLANFKGSAFAKDRVLTLTGRADKGETDCHADRDTDSRSRTLNDDNLPAIKNRMEMPIGHGLRLYVLAPLLLCSLSSAVIAGVLTVKHNLNNEPFVSDYADRYEIEIDKPATVGILNKNLSRETGQKGLSRDHYRSGLFITPANAKLAENTACGSQQVRLVKECSSIPTKIVSKGKGVKVEFHD